MSLATPADTRNLAGASMGAEIHPRVCRGWVFANPADLLADAPAPTVPSLTVTRTSCLIASYRGCTQSSSMINYGPPWYSFRFSWNNWWSNFSDEVEVILKNIWQKNFFLPGEAGWSHVLWLHPASGSTWVASWMASSLKLVKKTVWHSFMWSYSWIWPKSYAKQNLKYKLGWWDPQNLRRGDRLDTIIQSLSLRITNTSGALMQDSQYQSLLCPPKMWKYTCAYKISLVILGFCPIINRKFGVSF